MSLCFADARDDPAVGVIILTGARWRRQPALCTEARRLGHASGQLPGSHPAPAPPPAAGEGPLAFCSGGDQAVRGKGGYVGADGIPRLSVLDLQVGLGCWWAAGAAGLLAAPM
jgi:naphthoate synthase